MSPCVCIGQKHYRFTTRSMSGHVINDFVVASHSGIDANAVFYASKRIKDAEH